MLSVLGKCTRRDSEVAFGDVTIPVGEFQCSDPHVTPEGLLFDGQGSTSVVHWGLL